MWAAGSIIWSLAAVRLGITIATIIIGTGIAIIISTAIAMRSVITASNRRSCKAADDSTNGRTFVLYAAARYIGADNPADNCSDQTADQLVIAIIATRLMTVGITIVMGIGGACGNGCRQCYNGSR